MVNEGATFEDVKYGGNEPFEPDYKDIASGGLKQLGDNPLKKIDFVRAEAANNAYYSQNKGKRDVKQTYQLKKLFLQYAKKYANKWDAVINYPKQIRQKPAWFDLALSKFTESEISTSDKKIIKIAFSQLWDYRDRVEPNRVMSEEESLRQYGIQSPYYQPPESQSEVASEESISGESMDVLQSTPQVYQEPSYTESSLQPTEETSNAFGVRKVTPSESYLSGYMSPVKSTFGDLIPKWKPKEQPTIQQNTTVNQQNKISSGTGTGKGAFGIGNNMLKGISGSGSLQNIMSQSKPALPSQPVQVRPDETITVAPKPDVMQRKKKSSRSIVDRRTNEVAIQLRKIRSIELPNISKAKSIKTISPKSRNSKMKPLAIPNLKTTFDINPININKQNNKLKSKTTSGLTSTKGRVGGVSRDVKDSIGGVVSGIKSLKKQAKGEFRDSDTIRAINLKNIKKNKFKNHKDLGVLEKLKSETRSQVSREALECKMIPKLRSQCDKVFTKNHLTNEVSKFRSEFKDIHRMVPTVKGEKAKLNEVSMLGRSINHGVDGVHVDEIRSMYKNSGTTKQMNLGTMDYDYSFVTGKKKIKIPDVEEEYYEVE